MIIIIIIIKHVLYSRSSLQGKPIKQAFMQDCVLSPDFFLLYGKNMKEIKNKSGAQVENYIMNNLQCIDDIVLIAKNKKKPTEILIYRSKRKWEDSP